MTACTGGSGSSTSGVAAGDRGPEQLASSAATPGTTLLVPEARFDAAVEDITRLESELTRREADLEGLQTQLATLRSQAAMSMITLSLTQPAAEARAAEDRSGFQAGWHAGWRAFLGLLTALAALLGFSLPLVLPFAVVVVPLVLWWRGRRTHRRG